MDNHTVNNFVDILRDLIKEQIDKQDTTIMCKIVSVNQDGTYNVYVEPDERNIIHNIPSISPYTLKQDDYVYVYKIKNQLNNSFIIKRLGSDGALDTIPTKNEVISLIEEYTEKYNKTIQGGMILQPATNTTLGGVKASVTNETAEKAYGTKVYPIVISNGTIYGKDGSSDKIVSGKEDPFTIKIGKINEDVHIDGNVTYFTGLIEAYNVDTEKKTAALKAPDNKINNEAVQIGDSILTNYDHTGAAANIIYYVNNIVEASVEGGVPSVMASIYYVEDSSETYYVEKGINAGAVIQNRYPITEGGIT